MIQPSNFQIIPNFGILKINNQKCKLQYEEAYTIFNLQKFYSKYNENSVIAVFLHPLGVDKIWTTK